MSKPLSVAIAGVGTVMLIVGIMSGMQIGKRFGSEITLTLKQAPPPHCLNIPRCRDVKAGTGCMDWLDAGEKNIPFWKPESK